MTSKTRLKWLLAGKLTVLTLLTMLITPAIYEMLAVFIKITYIFFWSMFLSMGGGLATRWLIKSMIADCKKLKKKVGKTAPRRHIRFVVKTLNERNEK